MIELRNGIEFGRDVLVGSQPTPVDIEQLGFRGVRSCLSLAGERDGGARFLRGDGEASWASAFGMAHAHVPVDGQDPRPEDAERFLEAVARLPRPLFLHSPGGERAAAFAALLLALEDGKEGRQAWAAAIERGLAAESTDLYRFVVREVMRRSRDEEVNGVPAAARGRGGKGRKAR